MKMKGRLKMNYKFFVPDGNLMKREEFIEFYNNAYYQPEDNAKDNDKSVVHGLRRTERDEEGEIEILLKEGIKDKQDIIKILCWKTGGKQTDDCTVTTSYNRFINISEFAEFAINSSVATEDDAVEALKTIMRTENIGFTYAVTLLHFISQGRYPIYDKFAHIALLVIDSGSSFDCIIKDSELQGKGRGKNRKVEIPSNIDKNAADKNEKIKLAFEKYKENYIMRINRIFNMNYGKGINSDRTVGRALWVYGHLFNDKQTNRDRIARIRSK